MKQFSQAFNVIGQHRLLKVLDEASQAELAGIANLRDYEPAEVLHHEGEDATDVWIVVAGQVELIKLTTKGHEFMIELATPQDLFGAVFYAESHAFPNLGDARSVGSESAVHERSAGGHLFAANLARGKDTG